MNLIYGLSEEHIGNVKETANSFKLKVSGLDDKDVQLTKRKYGND